MSSAPTLTFLNHASIKIETERSILLVDPWLEGYAFNDGWALLDRSTSNERLLAELEQAGKKIHVWYSHEHSDHFAVPFLKQLKKRNPDAGIIFQKTLDRRVASFLEKSGFRVVESPDGQAVPVDDLLSITTWAHRGGDSYCLIQVGEWNLLNLNDCIVRNTSEANAILASVRRVAPRVDFLLTQFGYANWIGNESDSRQRKDAALEKFDRMAAQDSVLNPRFIIPFASFVYFCDPENFYLNEGQNSPSSVRASTRLAGVQEKIRFLKPGDIIALGDAAGVAEELTRKSPAAEKHWDELHSGASPVVPRAQPEIAVEEFGRVFDAYRKALVSNFAWMPHLFEMIGVVKPVRILVTDKNLVAGLSYRHGLRISPDTAQWDVAMTSHTLHFVLKNEYGFSTTHVNGRFRTRNPDSFAKFARFFLPQDFLKNGFGLKHPFASARMFIRILRNRLARKLRQA